MISLLIMSSSLLLAIFSGYAQDCQENVLSYTCLMQNCNIEGLFENLNLCRKEFTIQGGQQNFLTADGVMTHVTFTYWSKPTSALTDIPTEHPTRGPTELPTGYPTTELPTELPTEHPTRGSTELPTGNPTTELPTELPTKHPTRGPTKLPTGNPTTELSTTLPTKLPTEHPTRGPTELPTGNPTKLPTRGPTELPTGNPTTKLPTKLPTRSPTRKVYQMLGDKDDYVARDEGNEVKYYGRGFVNGKGGFFVNAYEDCEDACTETEDCHSFAYCGNKSCWLKDKVFNGDEATTRKGCATYYEL